MTLNIQISSMRVDGVLFDKDGTLFDFGATWNTWAAGAIRELAQDQPDLMERIAQALEFDLLETRFHPTSPIIAETNREAAERLVRVLPGQSVEEIEHFLMHSSTDAPLAPAVPLTPFLQDLSTRGLKLGVMTNDTEYGARSHLRTSGIEGHFDFIAGFDSGHGAKPDPDPLLVFAREMQLAPARVVMVGDSAHDLVAGRAAGMQTVGVLTGMAGRDELSALADVVLPDIGHLPAWLAS